MNPRSAAPATDAAESLAVQDFWAGLRHTTQARIGLGRTGDALPTREVLELRAAHAAARDAVHNPLDVGSFAAEIAALGLGNPVHVRSRAADRSEYLRRPDLGRLPADSRPVGSASNAEPFGVPRIPPHAGDVARTGAPHPAVGASNGADGVAEEMEGASAGALSAIPATHADIGVVLADGLSPRALTEHGVPMLAALVEMLGERYTFAPPVIATQARVALGDHIGAALGVRTVLVLIGERPGLSVADSLGIYLTHLPRPGRADSERNCVSNIHPPEGLGYRRAAQVVAGLVAGARRLGRSGVDLKDTSGESALVAADMMELAEPA
ncbi:ethanolamine ammonia-lyase subunit EutC [Nocardia inohanensis]|uniref:ethanolamine ammonia-lyase subunit EutC n=1 Tax=Nocardia inohanensis TaxID=209246 RepID=UPI000B038047|nr:ethanolamine ammonia-lyase subunit EutC [Nocardia inohanensis]